MNDTILVRLSLPQMWDTLQNRLPELSEEEQEKILEKTITAFQSYMEQEAGEFERGNGQFETCLYEAR